ncbi:MAG: hypothetical protein R3330_00675 [Saprospiraceae bacterium]|nr:hypothetical protein [Saprospiraceae bacterium]
MKQNINIPAARIAWATLIAGVGLLCISAINMKKDGLLRGMQVDVIQFDGGDYFLTQEDVMTEVLAVTGPLESTRLNDIDPSAIEEVLHHNPFIRHADVCVSSDRDLMITVRQRKPILRIFDRSGGSYYIDQEGMLIPVSPHFTARVIVATGHIEAAEVEHVSEHGQLQALHGLVSLIEQDDFLKSLVEQIHVNAAGQVQLVPKVGEISIAFGALERVGTKLDNLKTFYTEILPAKGWDQYESINLDYRGQIVCKKRQNNT